MIETVENPSPGTSDSLTVFIPQTAQTVGPQSVGPQTVSPQSVGPQSGGLADPKSVAQTVGPQIVGPQ